MGIRHTTSLKYAVLAALLILLPAPRHAEAACYRYEEYQDVVRGFSFSKPAGWTVSTEGGMILLSEPATGEQPILVAPLAVEQGTAPMQVAAAVAKLYMSKFPDYRIDASWQNAAGKAVRANFHYTDPEGRPKVGTFIVTLDGRMDSLAGLDTSRKYANAHQEAFLTCLQTFNLNRYQYFRTAPKSAAPKAGAPTAAGGAAPTITGDFTLRRTPDNTAYVYCPSHWRIGGGNIAFVAEEPDGSMGVVSFTEPYYGPSPPMDTTAWFTRLASGELLRASNLEILKSGPNEAMASEARAQGVNARVVSYLVRYVSGYYRQPTKGFFDVFLCQATPGSGFFIAGGCIAREDLFDRNLPVLASIARSIGTNTEVVMQRQREMSARLRQASRTMSQTGDILIAAINEKNRIENRIDAKWSDYYSGNQTMISTADNDVRRFDASLPSSVADPQYPGYEYRPLTNDEWDRYLRGEIGPTR